MKQFGTILKFELLEYLKNKVFVGVTVFLVALIAIVMFFPRIATLFESSEPEPGVSISSPDDQIDERPVLLLSSDSQDYAEAIQEAFAAAFFDYNVCYTNESLETVKGKITSGEAEGAFVLNGLTSYTYYVNNLSMYDENMYIANEVLQSVYRMNALVSEGLSPESAQEILSVQISGETENLGKDQMQNFFYTYIMVFALYMVILLYGQMVATNVATEKSSRAMEVLITSAKPTAMMFGKVVASCLAGLIQLVAVFGSALVCYQVNQSYWGGNEIVNSIFNMPLDLLLYMLLFFVLGFFIYAFLYGAVGSTASKLEDINTSVMPITMLFIIGFFVVVFSMSSGNVDNVLMTVCSFIPFTSPMAMFTRIAMSTVPEYQIWISVVLLLGSVFGVGVLSAKIYRVGVLLYGTTPKISAIIKAIRKA